MNIIEGNKEIAKFCGMKFLGVCLDSYCNEEYSYSLPDWLSVAVYGYVGAEVFLDDKQFATSWDWLMPACKKLVEVLHGKDSHILFWHKDAILKSFVNFDTQITWKKLVAAIEWYNTQPKTNTHVKE